MEENLNELKEELLIELFKDAEMPINSELTDAQKDEVLRALTILHSGEAPHEKLLLLQNKFLKIVNEQNKIEIENLKFFNNICLTLNGVVNLDADLLVVFSKFEAEDVDALISHNASVDNDLIFYAGLELKTELIKAKQQNTNLIFVNANNLNAKHLAKIVVKQNLDLQMLNDYLQQIFNFAKEKELKSVAIDFNSCLENEKIFKNLQKTVQNLNKKLKIKVVLKF